SHRGHGGGQAIEIDEHAPVQPDRRWLEPAQHPPHRAPDSHPDPFSITAARLPDNSHTSNEHIGLTGTTASAVRGPGQKPSCYWVSVRRTMLVLTTVATARIFVRPARCRFVVVADGAHGTGRRCHGRCREWRGRRRVVERAARSSL